MNPAFRTPAYRPFRAGMFAGMGMCAIFPVIHGLMIYGFVQMLDQIGLGWLVVQGVFYLTGTLLYAVSCSFLAIDWPTTDKVDAVSRISVSWKGRQVWCIPPDIPCLCGVGCSFSPHRSPQSFRL